MATDETRHSRHGFVTRHEFHEALETLYQRINKVSSGVDEVVAELGTVKTDLDTVTTDLASSKDQLQKEIDALASANPAIDLTALKEAAAALDPIVQTLDASAKQVGGLTPTPPAPPAPPAP